MRAQRTPGQCVTIGGRAVGWRYSACGMTRPSKGSWRLWITNRVTADLQGSRFSAFLKIRRPYLLLSVLIAATTFSCSSLAQVGCGRFQPIKIPTAIQNNVDMSSSQMTFSLEPITVSHIRTSLDPITENPPGCPIAVVELDVKDQQFAGYCPTGGTGEYLQVLINALAKPHVGCRLDVFTAWH